MATGSERVMAELRQLRERAEEIDIAMVGASEEREAFDQLHDRITALVEDMRHLEELILICPRCAEKGDCTCPVPLGGGVDELV